jgi:hypothetical protein
VAAKITYDVIDAQQHCRLKAYLRLCGEAGTRSDLEQLTCDVRQELRLQAIAKIRRQYREDEIATDILLSVPNLRKGVPFILNGHIEDDRHSIRIDGLKRVKGASAIGQFHPEPRLAHALGKNWP